jgi:hypothetical protein
MALFSFGDSVAGPWSAADIAHVKQHRSHDDAWRATSCVLLCLASLPAEPLTFREYACSPQRAVLGSSTAMNTSAVVAGGSGMSGVGRENRGGCTTILECCYNIMLLLRHQCPCGCLAAISLRITA